MIMRWPTSSLSKYISFVFVSVVVSFCIVPFLWILLTALLTFFFFAVSSPKYGNAFWQMAYGAKAALTYDTLWAAYTAMRSLTADGGAKLGIRPTILVVPVSLERAARRVIDREKLDNGESNELYKKFEIVVPDYL